MNVIKPNFLRLTLAVSLIIGSVTACSDEGFDSSIPDINFRQKFSLSIYNELKTAGTPYYYPGGYAGLIILNTGLEYYAYDAACPYEADPQIAVTIDGIYGVCPECGSKYNLWFGGAFVDDSGPSTESLKVYSAYSDGSYLFVTN